MGPRMILLKTGFAYHRSHPLQSLLIIIGIALGVAVIVAIDIANATISRSFEFSTESLTGRTTHQIIGSGTGIEKTVFTDLRTKLGLRNNAPVVEGYVKVKELGLRPLKLLGLDPVSEFGFRGLLGAGTAEPASGLLTGLMAEPGRVMLSEQLAGQYGIREGSQVTLLLGSRSIPVEVFGLLKSRNQMTQIALSGVVITDIASAQEMLEMGDRISRIDLIIPERQEERVLKDIRAQLPTAVTLIPAQKRSQAIRQMSEAFELNLTAMSLLALLVGMFLIYNTITFSVVQRRRILGILRALGTTRSELFLMVIFETLLLGLIGTTIGLGLGVLLGTGTVRLVSQTISDLYFVLSVTVFTVSPLKMVKAFGLGLLATLLSASFPAYEALRVPPVVAQRRSSLEGRVSRAMPIMTAVGLLTLLIGLLLFTIPTRDLFLSFGGLLLVVCGSAMLVPISSKLLLMLAVRIPGVGSGLIGRLSIRNISRSLSRAAVAIAALMIAVSVIIGVGIMVGSFRYTVLSWLNHTIIADVYIVGTNTTNPNLDPKIPSLLKSVAGIKTQFPMRSFQINSGQYSGTTLFAIEREVVERKWLWKSGSAETMVREFEKGGVYVSENFAWNHGITRQPGNIITLQTSTGRQAFSVLGIFRDFSSRQGMIVVHRDVYRQYWQDEMISGVGMLLESGVSSEAVIQAIHQLLADDYSYQISSNAAIRKTAVAVFDRTFTITVALQVLAALVALIGVFNAIMAMMLEKFREIGVLRASGMTIGQLWRLIIAESGIIGALSGLLAIPLGTAMAWILVFVINKRSFGWSLDFVVDPEIFLQAIALAFFASLAAGLYPSFTIAGKRIVDALRTE